MRARWAWYRLSGMMLLVSLVGCASTAATLGPIKPGDPVPGPHYLVWSQHRTQTGELWWRVEQGPVTRADCKAAVKRATSFPKVGNTKWYDITPQRLAEVFGSVITPDLGTWLSCWPEGYVYGEADE